MRIRISLPEQTLELHDDRGALLARYPVSTAERGGGERSGSLCTPRGRHIVRAKIGAGAPPNTVFIGRRDSGELWSADLTARFPERDWILSRILWLSGTEPGRNRLGDVDTMRRYIYLHGTPASEPMGVPHSHGCVRMRNDDIIELFDRVPPYTVVDIVEFAVESGGWLMLGDDAADVRNAVFVREQGVPEALEMDGRDPQCRHVLARDAAGHAIGTGRLLPDGHLGRIAVRSEWRGRGVGIALVERLIEEGGAAGFGSLELNAQVPAKGFYEQLGFVAEGPEFLEAGLAHRLMRRWS